MGVRKTGTTLIRVSTVMGTLYAALDGWEERLRLFVVWREGCECRRVAGRVEVE